MASPFAGARQVLDDGRMRGGFSAVVAEVGTADRPLWQHADGVLHDSASARSAALDTVFDLASLTKVLATAPLVMRLTERGALDLDDPIVTYLPLWRDVDATAVTVRDLLAHCSGLAAHAPLFLEHTGRGAFERAICGLPRAYAARTASVYSDLGFILLGFILERAGTLTQQFADLLGEMGGVEDLQFNPPHEWRVRTAATREDPWRGRLLVGEVDDDNASALGGIAGHAGLFGTAAAVGQCARHILQGLAGRPGTLPHDTLQMFVRRRDGIPGSSRGLGWDTMLPTSSCGTRMSLRAFGHVGFTGTSLWVDPDRGVYVTLLTNRAHPTSPTDLLSRVRPAFHDAVIEECDRILPSASA
jgi:CubicO group peptidase (beta-lactamase class C family)